MRRFSDKALMDESEKIRLKTLYKLNVLDREFDEFFSKIAKIAAQVCGVPYALITFIDEKNLWFKGRHGIDEKEVNRSDSPFEQFMNSDKPIVVNNLEDEFVLSGKKFFTYAGVSITVEDQSIGCLSIMHTETVEIDEQKLIILQELVEQIVIFINLKAQTIVQNDISHQLIYMFDNAPEYIAMYDIKNKKVFWHNKSLNEINPIEEIEELNFFNYHPEWAVEVLEQTAIPSVKKNGTWTGESAVFGHFGREIPVMQTLIAHPDSDGEIHQISTIMQDISNQKELEFNLVKTREKAQEASKLKSQFLANVSHEIRTPMNGIIGNATLLKDTDLTNDQKEMLEIIETCGGSLLSILNDVLDLSKVESNKLSFEKVDFDLKQAVVDVVKLFKLNAENKNVSLVHNVDEFERLYYQGDPTRIKQIITNFTSNALKFTDKGEVRINVEISNSKTDIHDIKIAVTDSGVGLTEEQQVNIFKAFTQADSSTTRKFGGTGLGLTISKKLANLMSGDISVESQVGQGSTFFLNIPLRVCSEEGIEKIAKSNIAEVDWSHFNESYPHKILVAEDNLVNQKLAISFFKKLGYDIELANDGLDAVKKCLENEYSLVFMDMHMPKLDGINATIEIHKLLSHKAPTIIALSANVLPEDKKRCIDAGMVDFLSKPFKVDDLRLLIEKYSEKQAA